MTVAQLVQSLLLLPQDLNVEVETDNETCVPTEVHLTEPHEYEFAGRTVQVPSVAVIR